MLEVGVFHQVIQRRILVEPLSVLLGPESVVEAPGVIWRKLGSHVPRTSRVGYRLVQPHRVPAPSNLDSQPDSSSVGTTVMIPLTDHASHVHHAASLIWKDGRCPSSLSPVTSSTTPTTPR